MYQKDLKPAALKSACADAVESCVHWAGVDLNTASSTLLQHVAGLGPKTAAAIVKGRPYTRRAELLSRKLLRPKLCALLLLSRFSRTSEATRPCPALLRLMTCSCLCASGMSRRRGFCV